MLRMEPGDRPAPGLPPVHTINLEEVPNYIQGVETQQVGYEIRTDGTGWLPADYLHVDLLATSSDFDIASLSSSDISLKRGGSQIWFLTPRRNGFLRLSVRLTKYTRTGSGRRLGEVDAGQSYRTILVDEPFFTVPWFEAHTFVRDLLFLWVPLLLGFIGGRIVDPVSPITGTRLSPKDRG
jgi:hypothetical protein